MTDEKPLLQLETNSAEPDDLRAKLKAADLKDCEDCNAAIQEALARFECQMVAVPVFTPDGRVGARVQVAKSNS